MESIITLLVDLLIDPVKRHIGFCVSSTNNIRDMHARVNRLKAAANDMEKKKVQYEGNSLVVPHQVPGWLTEFQEINEEVGRIRTDGYGCFNIKRYTAGKKSSNIITRIDGLEKREDNIKWTKEQIPPVDMETHISMPSTSGAVHDNDGTQNIFTSRKLIYEDVLKALDTSNKTQKMALCGMGGVGKTTMMEELKKVVKHKKMFDSVVMVVIGKKTDTSGFQQAIAEYIGLPLSETAEVVREERLKKKFLEMSENGAKKILVILDDVWDMVDLKVIGLASPLPSGFKLLLTSRDEGVCDMMDVEANSIFKMVGLEEEEAKLLFWETVGLSDGDDEFQKLGEDILKMCGGLPLAIKTISLYLKGKKKDAWEVVLIRLRRHDLEGLDGIMKHIFEISYDNLEKDDKAIFVLSGLFPDDFDIPLEDLTRYGWGLKLFYKANSLSEARKRINASIDNLKRANLLIESYYTSCVKMHDLARAFVLNNILKFKQASIINYGDDSEWPTDDTRECCERILLNCSGVSEFAQDFNYPNLVLLKIMTNPEESLVFPDDFYKRMGKLEVISYKNLLNPLLPVSLQCSASLRMLCLRSCSLPFDISFLGDLINLEVLSFAHCCIRKLPSSLGKLQKLKLLDLRGCLDLRIEAGVFEKLEKLEELYMTSGERKAIRFTEDNCRELEKLSGKLFALQVEIFENILEPKNMSFSKLERFKLSVGCLLDREWNFFSDIDLFKNTLKLATNRSKLLECKINDLFVKTEELHLIVNDLNHLEEILPNPSHPSFCDLKILCVSDCAELTSLFMIPVVNGMKKLESLSVSSCPVLESLIHDENSGVREISLPKLKSLTLKKLPNLVSLCDTAIDVMELPQLVKLELDDLPNFSCIFSRNDINLSSTKPLFNKEVVILKLEKLKIRKMEKLKEIWLCSGDTNEEVNNNISMLKIIEVGECDKFRNVFTPTSAHFGMPALVEIRIINSGEGIGIKNVESVENNNHAKEKEINVVSEEEISSKVGDNELNSTTHVRAQTFHQLTHSFHQLRKIYIDNFKGVEVLFEIETESSPSTNRELVTTPQQQLLLLPNLNEIWLRNMETLTHVWKCNWNEFLIQSKSTSFQNLTTINLWKCRSIKYLFSPLMVKLLSNLKTIQIQDCECMEEVVSNRDDEHEDQDGEMNTTTLFPHLLHITLWGLKNLKHVGGGVAAKGSTSAIDCNDKFSQVSVVSWSLCQYSREIHLYHCSSMVEVFGTREINSNDCSSSTNVNQGSTDTGLAIPRPKDITMHKLPNLKILYIERCHGLEFIFTFSILESLRQLEELTITSCVTMKVIVREENGEQTRASNVMVFPSLKSIKLDDLPNLVGFFLGKNDFTWPLLDFVKINDCSQMKVFTSGVSTAPKLKYIHAELGKHSLECGLNFNLGHETQSHSSSSRHTISEATPWSFHNLIEMNVNYSLKRTVIPLNKLQHLQKLEKIGVYSCGSVKEVFEVALEETNNGFDESQTVVKFPKLRAVELLHLDRLKYIWKSNQWRILEFPNLTTLSIRDCESLERVLTCSMVGSLMRLQELRISRCDNMEVIVKDEEEEYDAQVSEIKFPCLKSLRLERLRSLKGFYLGNKDLLLPSLNTLVIKETPELTIFTNGRLTVPELKSAETSLGRINEGEDINSFIISKTQAGFIFGERD